MSSNPLSPKSSRHVFERCYAGWDPECQRTRCVRFGDIELYRERSTVYRNGQEVALTRTEFRVLCELAEHPGWVLTRAQLLERVWDYDFFGDDRLVDTHIGRLRLKIEQDPSKPELIVTVRGAGYKLQT